jgi:class 3 adenylate cyclase
MFIVFLDIVAYSKRETHAQGKVMDAFIQSLRTAFHALYNEHHKFLEKEDCHLPHDLVVVQAGDGAAIGFPFPGQIRMPLNFVKLLLGQLEQDNRGTSCEQFEQMRWCNEVGHDHFDLRCGLSKGTVLLFRDVNGGYNMAGDPVNMAARVMGVGNARQVLLTEEYGQNLRSTLGLQDLIQYKEVEIKHDLLINPYQYIAVHPGIDSSIRPDLTLVPKQDTLHPSTVRPASSAQPSKTAHKSLTSSTAPTIQVVSNPVVKAIEDDLVLVPYDGVAITDPSRPSRILPIASPFLIGKYAITQAIYRDVTGMSPSHFQGDQRPVERVSWIDAVQFCNKLSELAGLAPVYQLVDGKWNATFERNGYRLPTEAEWEYACTDCGTTTSFSPLENYAWYKANSEQATHNVGKLAFNISGLFDMLGNVSEWCHDWYDARFPFPEGFAGPADGYERVHRGGSWIDPASATTPSFRNRRSPLVKLKTVGFRVVRAVQPK